MVHRRKLLATLGAISGTVALAGCSGAPDEEAGSDSEANSEEGEDEQTEDEQAEAETESLADISVDNINLTYGFSSGLRARITLSNQAEEGIKTVYTQIEAFDGDNSIGDDSTWKDITGGFSAEADLRIDLGSLSDNDIDDVTEFVISGRLEGEELTAIETLTGDELRERVDS